MKGFNPMNALYLVFIIIGTSTQNVLKKGFTQKFGGKGIALFNALSYASAIVFFVLTSSGLKWNPSILPYSLGFAMGFGTATICSTLAVACGSLSLTSLITSYSLMVPTVYGCCCFRCIG